MPRRLRGGLALRRRSADAAMHLSRVDALHSRPPRQHYVTASHVERWADDSGQVAVVCLCYRDTVSVPFGRLYYTRETASGEQETEWSKLEDATKTVIDGLHTGLGESLGDLAAAHAYLTEDLSRVETLINFAVLHHARSLVVSLRRLFGDRQADAAKTSAQIDQRWQDAHRRYHACGIEIVVDVDDSVPLGAVPVLDAHDWGGRPDGTAEFVMPLSPHVVICGAPSPGLTPREVRVVARSAASEDLVHWQVAGSLGLISSPFVVCEPSSAARDSQTALRFAEGGSWYRFVLDDRIEAAWDTSPRDRVAWKDRQACQGSDDTMCRSPFATATNKTNIWERSAARARQTQRELGVTRDQHPPRQPISDAHIRPRKSTAIYCGREVSLSRHARQATALKPCSPSSPRSLLLARQYSHRALCGFAPWRRQGGDRRRQHAGAGADKDRPHGPRPRTCGSQACTRT